MHPAVGLMYFIVTVFILLTCLCFNVQILQPYIQDGVKKYYINSTEIFEGTRTVIFQRIKKQGTKIERV